ncbi:MAG: hypothetical protein IPL28_05645 [Chloroflexi bacterium]|nr:hypothetical protein [Chloroflexota bacterium]
MTRPQEQKNKQKDLDDAEAKLSKAEQDIKKAEAAEKQADKQITAAQKKVDSATDAVNQRTTEFDTAKAKREQLENDLAAATTPEAQKSIQKDLDKARTAEAKAQTKKTQAEQKKTAADTAKTAAEKAKTDAADAKVAAEGEKTTAEGEKTTAKTAFDTAKTDADTKLADLTTKQDDFQQKLDKLDELDPAQAKALGKEKAKKSAAEKAGDVFNVLSLGTSRALTDSFRGGMYSTRDGTLKQWQNKGWAGQAHASGVTGGSIGMINAAINVATGGDIPSMTEWVSNKINFQKGADEYGAAGIEFDTKWPTASRWTGCVSRPASTVA